MTAYPATRLVSNRPYRSRPVTARGRTATWVTDARSGARRRTSLGMTSQLM